MATVKHDHGFKFTSILLSLFFTIKLYFTIFPRTTSSADDNELSVQIFLTS